MEADDRYTSGEYLEEHPTWHEEDSAWKADQIMRIVEKNDLDLRTVSEVGCGAGGILEELSQRLPEVQTFEGYEISPQAYEIAHEKANEKLSFFLADFIEDDKHYDLLLVIDVFEHVEDYMGFLRSIRDRADALIFHIPLDLSVQRLLLSKPILRRRRQLGHLHYFTKETALATLRDTGYEIVDWEYTASTLDLPTTSLIYSLGRLPLRIAAAIDRDLAVRILGGHSLIVLASANPDRIGSGGDGS